MSRSLRSSTPKMDPFAESSESTENFLSGEQFGRRCTLRSWDAISNLSDHSSGILKAQMQNESRFSQKYMTHALGPVNIALYNEEPDIPATYDTGVYEEGLDDMCSNRLKLTENLLEEMLNFFCGNELELKQAVLQFWKIDECRSENLGSTALEDDIPQLKMKELDSFKYTFETRNIKHLSKSQLFQQDLLQMFLNEFQVMKKTSQIRKLHEPGLGYSEEVSRERLLKQETEVHDHLNYILYYMFQSFYDVNLRLDGSNNLNFTTHCGRIPHTSRPDLLLRDETEAYPCIPFEICGSMEIALEESHKKHQKPPPTSTKQEYSYYYGKDANEEELRLLGDNGSRKLPDVIRNLNFPDSQSQYIKRKLYGQQILHMIGCLSKANKCKEKEFEGFRRQTIFRPRNECWGFFILHEIAIPVKLVCPTGYIDWYLASDAHARGFTYDVHDKAVRPPLYTVMNWHLDLSKQICRRALACLLKYHHQTFVHKFTDTAATR